MKKLLYLLALAGFASACEDPEADTFEYLFEDTIFSSSNQPDLRDLLITFTLTGSDSTYPYLAVDQLVDVEVDINGNTWTNGNTLPEETTQLDVDTLQGLPFATAPVQHVFIGQFIQPPTGTTAGDYAEVLNGFLRLKPGDYICEINRISFLDVNGDTVTIEPRITQVFHVATGVQSAHVGDFNISID